MAEVDNEIVNPFCMSDEEIKQKIYETHAHPEKMFDVDSLFIIVENILMHSTEISEEIFVQCGDQEHCLEKKEEKTPKSDFSVPLITLKQIVYEFSCKDPGEETTHKTTLSILEKLPNFPWVAKAVLTLAAFAMEFADFLLLAKLHQSPDQRLAKSLGTLKRVHVVLTQKHRRGVLNLNHLIQSTRKLAETVCEWEKLSCYDPKGVPALSTAVVAYWIITTVVTCATNVTAFTSDRDKAFDVSAYTSKVNSICSKLEEQLKIYRIKKEEEDHYCKVVKVLKDPTDIVEVFRSLFSTKDYVPPLIAGSDKTCGFKELGIEELRKKHVLLLISGREISDAEIDLLKCIHSELSSAKEKNYDQYKIVWVPIVEQCTDEPKKLFETLRSKIQCYMIELDRVTPGVTFIKKEWDFNGQPMVVVMNPQGKVENPNALHLIRLWGIKAFPFHRKDETRMLDKSKWIGPVMNMFPDAKTLMEKEDYIFFFGGRTMECVTDIFVNKINGIADDPIIKHSKITIKSYHVRETAKSEDESFWNRVESMFLLKLNQEKADLESKQEIQKLLSYKNEDGWAILSKGPVAMITGRISTFIKVLEEFINWRDNLGKKKFEVAFKERYSEIMKNLPHCCRLDIPIVAAKAPERMKCAECERTMEKFTSYKCCNEGG